jgi:predicted SprT family Zn-dependent metalloprotease
MAAAWFSGGRAADGKGSRMKRSTLDRIPETLRSKAQQWEELWGLPGMTESVTVEFSRRFRSSLGQCRPVQGWIRLAAHLETGNDDLLEEVLCHELAHVAVHRLHGRRVRPHGPEWKCLVSAAGFTPQARFRRGDGRFPQKPTKARAR